MKNETSRITATAIIIKSIMPLDVELYDDDDYYDNEPPEPEYGAYRGEE